MLLVIIHMHHKLPGPQGMHPSPGGRMGHRHLDVTHTLAFCLWQGHQQVGEERSHSVNAQCVWEVTEIRHKGKYEY